MGSSRTHQIQNCCPMNNQKSFRIFCCFAQLHRETIAVHELVLASLIYSQKGTMEGLIGRLLLNPLTPIPPVTGRDECRHLFHSKLDLICTRVLGGNILCSDTQIIVIGLMAAEIYRKMLRNLSQEKVAAKNFLRLHSMVKIARLDDASQTFLNWKQAQ